MTQMVEDFVRQQGKLEVTFFSIGDDKVGHILGAFVDGEGTFRLFDVKGFYNGLGELLASDSPLAGSWLRGLMSVEGTRYLPGGSIRRPPTQPGRSCPWSASRSPLCSSATPRPRSSR